MYFLQTVDIDLNCNNTESMWAYIYTSMYANYNGNNLHIINISSYSSFFGHCYGSIKNVKLEYVNNLENYGSFGGIVTTLYEGATIDNCSVRGLHLKLLEHSDSNIQYLGAIAAICYGNVSNCVVEDFYIDNSNNVACYVGGAFGEVSTNSSTVQITNIITSGTFVGRLCYAGGIVGRVTKGVGDVEVAIDNCKSNFHFQITAGGTGTYCGGIVGLASWSTSSGTTIVNISKTLYNGTIEQTTDESCSSFGGIVAYGGITVNISDCAFMGDIIATTLEGECGGIVGYVQHMTITNCLSQGNLTITSAPYCGGIHGKTYSSSSSIKNNISNTNIINNLYSASLYPIGNPYNITIDGTINYYNSEKNYSRVSSTTGTKTAEELKDINQYSNWETFDEHWVINPHINDGYPMLRAHLSSAQVTDFDGSGTEDDPYQIKTTADLQGMQAYYNDYNLIDEYYWILINDLDISVDANDLTINWCPIGYEGGVITGFNGHFDGNGKTINGLTITEQYENVGLFGRMSSNATITNLNVTGTINWDQATNVGGVVGLMEDGAKVTNCTFTGTITGYLNSGNYATVGGLVGSYSLDAVTGSANYDAYVYGTNNYTTFNRYTTTYTAN